MTLPKCIVGLFVLFLLGCTTPMDTFKSNSNGWRPADFTPDKGILLIEKVTFPQRQQRKIEEYMAKHYRYKYQFVDTKELQSNLDKYSDKTIYRFALVNTFSTYSANKTDGASKFYNATDFSFIDRLKEKQYPKTGIQSSWASMTFEKIIETILKKQS